MIFGVDYRFRDDLADANSPETVPVELLLGKYRGIIYRYTEVKISEEKDGTAKLKFGYHILHLPYDGDHTPDSDDLQSDHLFNKVAGVILNQLILDSVGIKEDDENDRDHYSEEPDNK